MSRPSTEEYYLGIAEAVSKRGTCLRRNFGAIIVNNNQIISTGYTGAPRKAEHCIDIGRCLRDELDVPLGERYELCRSVHAEMNAIIHAARRDMLGGDMYLVGITAKTGELVDDIEPCKMCKRMIINAGIKAVYVRGTNGNIKKIIVKDWLDNSDDIMYGDERGY